MKPETFLDLTKKVNSNSNLKKAVILIQKLNIEQNVSEEINKLDFPLGIHLFIMGNYSDLMCLKFK